MNPSADVASIAALHEWRAALCAFRAEALDALAAVALAIQRTLDWLTDEQRRWQRAARDAEEEVAQARAELFNRRIPDFSGRVPDCTVQEEALWAAQAKLRHAEDQIDVVRGWMSRLPRMVDEEYEGPARRLGHTLEGDLPRGIALLDRRIAALEAYAALRPQHMPESTPKPGTGGKP